MGFLVLILYPAASAAGSSFSSASSITPHTPSFTHNFVTYHLSHNFVTHTHNFVTYHLSHTNLSPIIFHTQLCHTHTQLCHTPSFTHNFVTHLGWLWWRAWTGLVAGDAAALCVAGVALGDIHLRFTWQA